MAGSSEHNVGTIEHGLNSLEKQPGLFIAEPFYQHYLGFFPRVFCSICLDYSCLQVTESEKQLSVVEKDSAASPLSCCVTSLTQKSSVRPALGRE